VECPRWNESDCRVVDVESWRRPRTGPGAGGSGVPVRRAVASGLACGSRWTRRWMVQWGLMKSRVRAGWGCRWTLDTLVWLDVCRASARAGPECRVRWTRRRQGWLRQSLLRTEYDGHGLWARPTVTVKPRVVSRSGHGPGPTRIRLWLVSGVRSAAGLAGEKFHSHPATLRAAILSILFAKLFSSWYTNDKPFYLYNLFYLQNRYDHQIIHTHFKH
jgi:hypothetical protein